MLADTNEDIRQSVDTCLTSFLEDICEIYKNTPVGLPLGRLPYEQEDKQRLISERNNEILEKRKLSPTHRLSASVLSAEKEELSRLKDELGREGALSNDAVTKESSSTNLIEPKTIEANARSMNGAMNIINLCYAIVDDEAKTAPPQSTQPQQQTFGELSSSSVLSELEKEESTLQVKSKSTFLR